MSCCLRRRRYKVSWHLHGQRKTATELATEEQMCLLHPLLPPPCVPACRDLPSCIIHNFVFLFSVCSFIFFSFSFYAMRNVAQQLRVFSIPRLQWWILLAAFIFSHPLGLLRAWPGHVCGSRALQELLLLPFEL